MNEVTQVENTTADTALYLITKAEIDQQVSTAKAFPRSLAKFMETALSMATLNEEIAQSCIYALPRGGKVIEGPSVRLAEIIASSYENIRAGARIIDNDGRTITSQGICHDLERNYCATIEVKRRITDKNGKSFNDDMQVIAGNAGSAIAYRNAVFKVVPAALVQNIYEQVKQVAKGTAATLQERRTKAVSWFNDQGVKSEQICAALAIKKIEDIDLDKLSVLTGMRSAIKNGESTLKEMFDPEKPKAEVAKPEFTELHFEAAHDAGATIETIRAGYTTNAEIEQQYNDYVNAKKGK